jgi:hypothetical protein
MNYAAVEISNNLNNNKRNIDNIEIKENLKPKKPIDEIKQDTIVKVEETKQELKVDIKAEIKEEKLIVKENSKNNEKDNILSNNAELKRKKEILEKKLNDQKLQKRYDEIPFPNISNRVKQLDVHFKGKPAVSDSKYNTNKSEAEEVGDRIIAEKPVFKKKMKSKPAEFQE